MTKEPFATLLQVKNEKKDEYLESYTAMKVSFIANANTLKGFRFVTVKTNKEIKCWVSRALIHYLNSNTFRKLARTSKNDLVPLLLILSDFFSTRAPKGFQNVALFKEYFEELRFKNVSKTTYNRTIHMLKKSFSAYQVVNTTALSKKFVKAIPDLIPREDGTKLSLADTTFTTKYSVKEEKSLFTAFLSSNNLMWQIQYELLNYHEELSKEFEIPSLAGASINEKKLEEIHFLYRSRLVELLIENRDWKILAAITRDLDEIQWKGILSKFEIPKNITKMEFLYQVVFRKQAGSYGRDSSYKQTSKIKGYTPIGFPVDQSLSSPEDCLHGITSIELTCMLVLLSKMQLQRSLIYKLTAESFTIDDSLQVISIRAIKSRSKKKPSNTGRGVVVKITKLGSRVEYELMRKFITRLHSYYTKNNISFDEKLSNYFVFTRPGPLRYLDGIYGNYSNILDKDIIFWIKARHVKYEVQKGKDHSIQWGNITQSAKIAGMGYRISLAYDADRAYQVENEILAEVEASKQAHSHSTRFQAYDGRSQSPIVIESEVTAGRQLADAKVEDSRLILDNIEELSFQEAKKRLGVQMESENWESNSEEQLAMFFNKTGKSVNDFLGIEDEMSVVIVKHPVVLIFIKKKIWQLDHFLDQVSFDQIAITEEESDRVKELSGLRAVLGSIANRFSPSEHAEAEIAEKNYEWADCDPII